MLLGRRGERAIEVANGDPKTAEDVADRSLVAVQRLASGFRFIAADGSTWSTKTLLGPLGARTAPPQTFEDASASERAIVAVGGGAVHRSTDGVTWAKVAVPVAGAAPRRIRMRADGVGLLLFSPERLLVTTDDGATFRPIASPTAGALAIDRDETGDLFVLGVASGSGYEASASEAARLTGTPPSLVAAKYSSSVFVSHRTPRLLHGVHARGEAGVFGANEWLELIPSDTSVELVRQNLGELTSSKPLAKLDDCRDATLAVAGDALVVACVREAPLVEVLRSSDRGKLWSVLAKLVRNKTSTLRLFGGGDGSLLISGACLTGPSCASPWLVRSGGSSAFTPAVVPAPGASLLDAHFVGTEIVALGASAKRAPTVFRSVDGGKSFDAHELGPAAPHAPPPAPAMRGALGIDPSARVVTFADGFVRRAWSKREGSPGWSAIDLPFGTMELGVAGARLLIGTATGSMMESSDAGSTWRRVAAPSSGGTIHCSAAQCWIGSAALRVGWSPDPTPSEPSKGPPAHRHGTPLRCHEEGKPAHVGWTASSGWTEDRSRGVAWSRFVRSSGALELVTRSALKPVLERVSLLPSKHAVGYFTRTGALALESIPYGPPPDGLPTLSVAFAVWHAKTGKLTRGTIDKLPWGMGPELLGADDTGFVIRHGDALFAVSWTGKVLEERAAPPYLRRLTDARVLRKGTGWSIVASPTLGTGLVAESASMSAPWTLRAFQLQLGFPLSGPNVTQALTFGDETLFALVRTAGDNNSFLASAPVAASPPEIRATFARPVGLPDPPPPCPPEADARETIVFEDAELPRPILFGAAGKEQLFVSSRTALAVARDGRSCVRGVTASPLEPREPGVELEIPFGDLAHASAFTSTAAGTTFTPVRCSFDATAFSETHPRARELAEYVASKSAIP